MGDTGGMDAHICDKFETICRSIRRVTPPSHRWQWDERFHVALMAFDKIEMEAIFSAVIGEFMHQWDYGTIAKSSKIIRKLVKNLFDIKPGQLIFTSDENLHSVLLAAWWPWANGSIISLRIGIFPAGRDPLDRDEIKKCLVEWFDIET
jgi:hypothetical protein